MAQRTVAPMPSSAHTRFATELIIIRRFLTEGTEAVGRGDDISIRVGIILVDLAAETLLKTVLRWYGKPVVRAEFPPLLKEVQTATQGSPDLGFVNGLRALRNTRNCVVHDGTGQDAHVARDLVARARGVLVRLVLEVWALDLLNLRIVDFISDDRTRTLLAEAAASLEAKRFAESAGVSRAIFEHIVARWTAFNQNIFALREGPTDNFAQIIGTVTAGVYLPDLQRFRQITDRVPTTVSVSGDISTVILGGWGTNKSEAEQAEAARFALDFVGGIALQVEERLASSPHGRPF